MFTTLFRQLTSSIGVVLRTFRTFFTRQLTGIWARVKSVTSLTRQASKLAPKMLKTATTAGKKPTKRSDYVETKSLFIAKSFFVVLGVALVAVGALVYFVIWPWMLSRFFTAKLWVDDADTAGHSGRVVLFYDEGRTQKRFEGKLTDGLAQERGVAYDQEGRVLYTGEYVDDLYEGDGKLYEKGVLRYEGAFAGGQFNGDGTLYADDGTVRYTGAFQAGQFQGEGTLYEPSGATQYSGSFAGGEYDGAGSLYQDGYLIYKGDFAAGEYNGQGVEYYPSGKVKYKGAFLDGLYTDSGTLYRENGGLLYTGGFAEGLYSGAGSLYLDENQRVDADFENGLAAGHIDWYKNGNLYYSGAAADLTPHGYGEITSSTGAALYAGDMLLGSLDMPGLLGLEINDVRDKLGSVVLREETEPAGFTVTSRELGLTVYCNYQTEDKDALCQIAYLWPGQDSFVELLPWASPVAFETWLTEVYSDDFQRSQNAAKTDFKKGVPYEAGNWYCRSYTFEDATCRLWSETAAGPIRLVEWRSAALTSPPLSPSSSGSAASLPGGSSGAEEAVARLDALVKMLQKNNAGVATPGITACVYYGNDPVAALLQTAAQQNTGFDITHILEYQALDIAMDFFELSEKLDAAEQNLALKQELLDDEEDLLRLGSGDRKRAETLTKEIDKLILEISGYRADMKKLQNELLDLIGVDPADYELQQTTLLFDPVDIVINDLVAAAQATEAAAAAVGNTSGSVSPTTVDYDAATGQDLPLTLDPAAFRLLELRWNNTPLRAGIEYTVSGGVYTLTASWLASQSSGSASLTFDLSGGTDPTVSVLVYRSATVTPGTASFDPAAPADVSVTLGSEQNELLGLYWNGAPIPVSGYRYVGDTVTLSASWLRDNAAASSVATLTFDMQYGSDPTVSVTVGGGSGGSTGSATTALPLQRTAQRVLASTPASRASDLLTDLQAAHQRYQKALSAYEKASEKAKKAQDDYKKANVDKAGLFDALIARNEARMELYAALTDFARAAAALNKLTGGYLSQKYGWLDSALLV